MEEKAAHEGLLTVCVKLFSYWLDGEDDLYMGEVNVSVLFANGNVNKTKSVTYPIRIKGETTTNAKLSLSYRFKPVPVNDLYPPPQAPDFAPPLDQPVYPNPNPARSDQPIIYSPQFQITGQTTTVTKLAMELVIKSARYIKNVNVFDDMDVYASVMIRDGETTTKHKTKTPIAYSGFIFPTWNHKVKFSFDEEELPRENRLTLVVELVSHRPLLGDKHIGEVKVGIQELIDSNPPSPSNGTKLVTHQVTRNYGERGTLNFTYRFLKEQVMIPNVPDATPQPFIMYIPVPYPSYGSANPIQGTNVGPSNGLVPIYMQPPYQPQGYQQYPQPQLQSQPQPQQQLPIPQSQSQLHGYQQYAQPQPQPPPQNLQPQPQPQPQLIQPQPQPPQLPTQSQVQMQGVKPQKKTQGAGMAALGLGATVLGRVIGGALMSEMTMSDEVNIYEVGTCEL